MDPEKAQPLLPSTEIHYVGIGKITIYLVSDDELHLIERGGPSSTMLNLALSLLSMAASFLTSFLLNAPSDIRKFTVMVVLIASTGIAGTVLLFLWRRFSKDATETIKRIRSRNLGKIVEGVPIL